MRKLDSLIRAALKILGIKAATIRARATRGLHRPSQLRRRMELAHKVLIAF
jgi:hypothetical protein